MQNDDDDNHQKLMMEINMDAKESLFLEYLEYTNNYINAIHSAPSLNIQRGIAVFPFIYPERSNAQTKCQLSKADY
ncbi:hypothetical protein PHYBLDRAFT_153137 [Phycomyces blakesleeanus NRRL 1555(-)]|uniref:Uncharacterized protein n=1 Tax=Phycomyces blakesleeanus (strain ATCC 8743b / DSM 1359 / FGSC 10004 / NBRC 33097 / NRRL 1555) TaxID=763407 RepID=A0A167JBN0_PHYB8|nr:hypothetical protein PHYBLDRAFT_153848 [Phycomyces blakesleeanus NRRL 1555(-)]XP_018283699.1 hypothetical protein PHYBLDRAFT_153137 [Phycomyces blakesleeanus NRRL 1555(-)]OAD65043.1 hypothetical protein PHYBLDRAFT_153848 [Phycomyces blakesleeanus NRRL 1555(-)]OAD65659.1 hypothetical protein PHYBLDRAFT_153137 [Phycomyces blakesleeanus NRRL 1555(-)]|eukprot:XP_018283083.1 hypothetical protein PHYBLDRAFT_153848 [Phycomyces blakesleeanus NRRL 1555(-)]